jgi:hypothetical protein
MAVNPMQRRARNSFLIGFLVALIIMALVVVFLLTRIKALNEEKEALINERSEAIVCTTDLDSGAVVTFDGNFTQKTVITDVPRSEMVSIDDFIDETEDGSEAKEITMKIAVPSGTIVTKDMIQDSTDLLSDTQRIQEYNMILLPSHLKNGDYVDIRLSLPNGQDYIVLSKKRVLGTDATTVWFKLDEMEINLMNSAIVESYTINGSKLYAIEYVEPGLQEPTIKTYTVSQDVFNFDGKRFLKVKEYHNKNIHNELCCKCCNYLYGGDNLVNIYSRHYIKSDNNNVLVYDLNKLKDGFNGKIIKEW